MDTTPAPKMQSVTHQHMPMFDDPISEAFEDESRVIRTIVRIKVVAGTEPLQNSMRLPDNPGSVASTSRSSSGPTLITSRSGPTQVEVQTGVTTNGANESQRQPQPQVPTASVVFDKLGTLNTFRWERWSKNFTKANAGHWIASYQKVREMEMKRQYQA